MILACLSVFGKPPDVCLLEAGFSGFADSFSADFVLVIWGHISDALVVAVPL